MEEPSQNCPAGADGERVSLTLPAALGYQDILGRAAEAVAGLAGLGPHAAGRARLLAQEVFSHVAAECAQAGGAGDCRLDLTISPDGLVLCFTADHLSFDPQVEPVYPLGQVLEGSPPQGLGLQLLRRYATGVTLVRRGAARELCLTVPRGESDQGARAWSQLVPSLAPGLTLTPVEREGRLRHRLDDARRGKSYLARSLAHHVLSLIDGQRSFGRIMAQTLKVMPEAGRHGVEDLFEVLIARDLVILRSDGQPGAGLQVRQEREPLASQALAAYQKAAREQSPENK